MRPNSLFIARPKPIEGESLSSWRQRSAWRNSYKLFPVSSESLRRTDPDVGLHGDDLAWVASAHDLAPEQLVSLTLNGMQGQALRKIGSHSQPGWWLRSRVAGTKQTAGPMFCPQCLLEDEKPFFRLHWRLGFFTACPVHDLELLEHCPNCFEPAWPGGAGMRSKLCNAFASFRHCWSCGYLLTDSNVKPSSAAMERALLCGMKAQTLALGDNEFSPVEVLEALRGICQIFLRTTSRTQILDSGWEGKQSLQSIPAEAFSALTVELLGISHRRVLLSKAWPILTGWPDSFRDFCSECGLLKWHFHGTSQLHPQWFNGEIEQNLKRQNRSVSRDSFNHALSALGERLGRSPTKTELRRELQWQGSRYIEDAYRTRVRASSDEMQQLFANASDELIRCRRRRHSLFHAAVDIAVIVVCILDRSQLEDRCAWRALDLEQYLDDMDIENNVMLSSLVDTTRSTLRTYPLARKHMYTPKLRQVKKRFASLVQTGHIDLLKMVSAYWLSTVDTAKHMV